MPSETLVCVDCEAEFEFTENDQEFYERKGFAKPKRCKPCREKKKVRFDSKDNPVSQ